MYIIPIVSRGKQEPSLFTSTSASDPPLSATNGIKEMKRLLDSGSIKVSPAVEEGYAAIGNYPLKDDKSFKNYPAFYGSEKLLRALARDANSKKDISEEFLADIFHLNIS